MWFAATSKDPKFKQLAAEALASETEVEFEAASTEVDDAAEQLFDAASGGILLPPSGPGTQPKPRLLKTFEDRREDFIDAAGRSLGSDP